MRTIPKIIHQIWSDAEKPLPDKYKILGETWQRDYPDWEYRVWNDQMIIDFVKKYYPQHLYVFHKYPYNVQRWDAIRYLILDKIGGMYVDFDYESIKPMNELLADKTCCFALEKEFTGNLFTIFNNALMLSVPNHPFIKRIVNFVLSRTVLIQEYSNKTLSVFNTTGPYALIRLYDSLTKKEQNDIYLIPAKHVSPFTRYEAEEVLLGIERVELEEALEEAYAVHYYSSDWAKSKVQENSK